MTTSSVDQDKLMALVGQALGDMGAVLDGSLIVAGDKLGIFKAIRDGGSLSSDEVARLTNTNERSIRELLNAQAAAGYVTYDGEGRYSLSPEQAEILTDEDSPFCMLGGFQAMTAATRSLPTLVERFRTGTGFGWHEHDSELFEGTRRFFQPGYVANLVSSWLPALEGVTEKLTRGATIADVGCGQGASTIIMAKAFPNSQFVGFDYHAPSIDAARKAAARASLSNCSFEVASAKDYPGKYDLVCHFDCLHDMGDPVGAARHTRESLKSDGTWMLVEPFAHDELRENLNLVGKVFYAASALICTQASLSQEVGAALGAQAGEARLRAVAMAAGFSSFRRATETPFNLVLEGKA